MRRLRVGLLGCGTVGGGFVQLLTAKREAIRRDYSVDLTMSKILVRDRTKERRSVDPRLLTLDPDAVTRNGCDLVVELIGGVEPARSFIVEALDRGKHVVTANKSLLASCGAALFDKATERGVRIGFEASVCGAIPVIRVIRGGLAGNRIERIHGVLNGTCNYILTQMAERSLSFEAALQEAQVRGFAEADPALDVDGHDAAQKLKILAELAFRSPIPEAHITVEGIRNIGIDEIRVAARKQSVIRLVATASRVYGRTRLTVKPAVLAADHPLARARGEVNAVIIESDAAGELILYGRGAGAFPSASSVLADVVEIARGVG